MALKTVLPAHDLYVGDVLVVSAAGAIAATASFTAPVIDDGDDGCTIASADQTNASATVTIPDIGDAADTFVMADTAQTLANKTLTAPKIVTTGYIADAGGDEYLKFVEATTPVNEITITSANANAKPRISATGTDTNIGLELMGKGTGNVTIVDAATPTKAVAISAVGITATKTATLTFVNTDDAAITFPAATATLATVGGTETLTGKTLTAPVETNPALSFTIGTHDYGTGSADWTLNAAEALLMVHKPTNAGAGANAIIPTTPSRPYIFINGSGQIITVKTAGGSGIAIANGKTHIVMSDGTNVIALAAVSA
jgi:hypothetical protein